MYGQSNILRVKGTRDARASEAINVMDNTTWHSKTFQHTFYKFFFHSLINFTFNSFISNV